MRRSGKETRGVNLKKKLFSLFSVSASFKWGVGKDGKKKFESGANEAISGGNQNSLKHAKEKDSNLHSFLPF